MENGYWAGNHDRPADNVEIQDFSRKVTWNVINQLSYPFEDIFSRPVGEDMRRMMVSQDRSIKVVIDVQSALEPNFAAPIEDALVYEATFSVEEKQGEAISEALVNAAYELYEKERTEWEGDQEPDEES